MTSDDGVRSLPPGAVAVLLRESRMLSWARLSPDGTLRAVNGALARRVGIPANRLPGTSIYLLLTEDDKEAVRRRVEEGEDVASESFLTNFVSTHHEVHTLRCRIFPHGDDLVMVGEPDVEEDRAVAEELLRLNSEMSVLSRENVRRAREVEGARRELEATLAELESSYWHLRKIQEKLPFCMKCGKMKTGAAEWTSLLDYLRANEIFVSHGYCPTCAEELFEEMEV